MKKAIAIALLAAAGAFPGVASAAYGPGADLVSINPVLAEQGNDNVQNVAISQNGRFVVFQTTSRNLYPVGDSDPPGQVRQGGIFRWDLDTKTLDLVAYGDLRDQTNKLIARGAQSPSISADGRFVAFSSGWKLVPADTNSNPDVYVRDMTKPISASDAYQLASAKDGGTAPATYGTTFLTQGADITTGTSISADGTKVLFRTAVPSNLPNVPDVAPPGGPPVPSLTTPGGQLFVRDLMANTTTLVTRSSSDGSPAGGVPVNQPYAALSADGSTVVWSGLNATKQTPFLPKETPNDGVFFNYLWRRVADGPGASTRRITGPADLDDPACTPALQSLYDNLQDSSGPCYGVLQGPEGDLVGGQLQSKAPVLSADGYRVAFLTGVLPRGLPGTTQFDLFVTDMHPGTSRKQGTTQLTTHNLAVADDATNDPILSVAMSADGRRVAFITGRTTFLLPTFRLTDPPLPVPGIEQLYVIDFDRSTIQLASRGVNGGGANQTVAAAPSMSGDGKRIAFASGATNLYAGDANEKSDAFVVTDTTQEQQRRNLGEQPFSDYGWDPPGTAANTGPRLGLAIKRARALVRLKVTVPGAGKIDVTARGKGGTIARTTARPRRAGTTTVVLRPKGRFRTMLRRRGHIAASVTVRFTPHVPGPSLTASRRITFKR